MSGTLTFSTHHRPRGARLGRGVLIGLVALVVVLLAWGLSVGALWSYAWFRLGGDDIPALRDEDGLATLGSTDGPRGPADATTVMVVLTDSVDPTVPRPPALESPVHLVQVGGPRDEPAVLQLPSDVPLTSDLELAAVQADAGTDPLLRAVVDYTEIRVDHVVSLSIDALPRLIEAVGPIEVCRTEGCSSPSADELRSALLTATDQELIHLVADVTRSIAGHLDTRWALTSPIEVKRVVDALAEEVVTDAALRGRTVLDLAEVLADPVRPQIDRLPTLQHPGTGEPLPLHEAVQARLQPLRDGAPLGGRSTDELQEELLAGLEVAVLNGAGADGLASQVQVELEAAGFRVTGTGNAPTFDRERTVLTYQASDDSAGYAAYVLSELLGGAEVDAIEQRPTFEGDEVDLLVVAGEDIS